MRTVVATLLLCAVGCGGTVEPGPEVVSGEGQDVVAARVAEPAQIVEPARKVEPVRIDDAEWDKLASEFDVQTDEFTQVVTWFPLGSTFLEGKEEYCSAGISVRDGHPIPWIKCGYKYPSKFIVLQDVSFKIGKTVCIIEGEVDTDINVDKGPRETMFFSGQDAPLIMAAVKQNPDGKNLLRLSGGKGTKDRSLTKKETEVLSRTAFMFDMMQVRAAAGQSLTK